MNDGLNALAMDHWAGRSIDDLADECSRMIRDPGRKIDVERLLADLQALDQPDHQFCPLK